VTRIYTRTTIVWFVVAGVTGGVSVFLHLVRRHVAGDGSGAPLALTLLAFGLSAVTAVLVFHGIMVAAYEQDQASPRPRS
jgi:hypothetical protein